MDFIKKRHLYKKEKYNLPKIMKDNKKIFTGSGGSNNITILYKELAIKVIPEYTKQLLEKTKRNNDQKEIDHYILFTNELILPNITPHIVGYYSHYKLFDVDSIFPKKCMSVSEKLLIHPDKIDWVINNLCRMKQQYKDKVIMSRANILILENCNTTIEKEIKKIINTKNKNKYKLLAEFIDRTVFQFMYTMAQIQKMYPRFIHNDMFLRNILGVNDNSFDVNDCVEYIWNNESYYLPANGFYLKINDFGYSLNPPKIVSTLVQEIKSEPSRNMEIYDPKRDIYTFLYDYYNGANFGHPSVMFMINNASTEIKKKIRKQFSKYIDVSTVDKIQKHNKSQLDWIWSIGNIKILQDCVDLPADYFKDTTFNKYKSKKNCNIVHTFTL